MKTFTVAVTYSKKSILTVVAPDDTTAEDIQQSPLDYTIVDAELLYETEQIEPLEVK